MSTKPMLDNPDNENLALGLRSFHGSRATQIDGWRTSLRCGQPSLYFLFKIDPLPDQEISSQIPGIAPEYDIFVVWRTFSYRIAVGRPLFSYNGDEYFLAFIYPHVTPSFFNGTFGIIRAPSSCVKYSAFAPAYLQRINATTTNSTTPELWHPIVHFLRLNVTLNIPTPAPASIPLIYSMSPFFIESMGTTWALTSKDDGTVLICDAAANLVDARHLNTEHGVDWRSHLPESYREEDFVLDHHEKD